MRTLLSFFVFAVGLALAVAPALAQQPAPGSATASGALAFHTQPRAVELPVTVRNKHGKLVPGLTAADFTLTEDGRPQTIQSFTSQSGLPFDLGLLIDTSRTVEPGMAAERTAAEKFLDQMLPANPASPESGNQAFLIHFDSEVELLRDFTNSRAKLDQEIETMGPTSAEHNNPQGPETVDNGGYGQGEYGARNSHGGTQLYDAIYLASNDLMKAKIGRKALIVFSDGVDRGSKETQSDAIDAAEHANTVVYAIYFRGGEPREGGFPGMGRHGRQGGGYPGSGGGWPGSDGGYPGQGRIKPAPIDGKKVMEDIAHQTGGQFFEARKTSDLAPIYDLLAKTLERQYVLTYVPNPADDGSYHKIVLRPKKANLFVVTRDGYYGPGDRNSP